MGIFDQVSFFVFFGSNVNKFKTVYQFSPNKFYYLDFRNELN